MAVTYDDIRTASASMRTIQIKGKPYVQVLERVKAYRSLWPKGSIQTEILNLDENMVVIRATVADENGKTLATGTAFEMKGSSMINRTSYIENCETSAVGRALGMLALGIDASIASADEVRRAIDQQEQLSPEPVPDDAPDFVKNQKNRKDQVYALCERLGIDVKRFGEWKKAAIANGMIPDKLIDNLSDLEFDLLMSFVEENAK